MATSERTLDKAYTLKQFIQLRSSNEITYSDLCIFSRSITNNDLIYGISNLFNEYLDFIKPYAKILKLTDAEKIKYKYKPKLMAFEIYENTECDWILLALNGMCNAKEFNLETKRLLAFTPTDLNSILTQIINGEADYKKLNRRYIYNITE